MSREVQLPAPGRGAYDRSLSRPERDAEHRDRLLRATAEVFAEGTTTVARIVERAGVGRSTFYEFFDSPEHLLDHLEQRAVRSLEDTIQAELVSARTPLEQVRSIIRGWLLELSSRATDTRFLLCRGAPSTLLSPAGQLLHRTLEQAIHAARLDRIGGFNSTDDASLLAAAAAVEALSRRHLVEPMPDPQRVLCDVVTKLLR